MPRNEKDDDWNRRRLAAHAALQAICISATQEASSNKGVIPDWDKGFFAGQIHMIEFHSNAHAAEIDKVKAYLHKLNDNIHKNT